MYAAYEVRVRGKRDEHGTGAGIVVPALAVTEEAFAVGYRLAGGRSPVHRVFITLRLRLQLRLRLCSRWRLGRRLCIVVIGNSHGRRLGGNGRADGTSPYPHGVASLCLFVSLSLESDLRSQISVIVGGISVSL